MPAPAYIALQGQAPIEIDHAYTPIVTGFNRRLSIPTTVKKSAGAVGMTQGIPDVSGSFTVMTPAGGMPFDHVALNARPDGFPIAFPFAGSRLMIQHCKFSEVDIRVNPASGDIEGTYNFVGTNEVTL